jgi:hypothetical protein
MINNNPPMYLFFGVMHFGFYAVVCPSHQHLTLLSFLASQLGPIQQQILQGLCHPAPTSAPAIWKPAMSHDSV